MGYYRIALVFAVVAVLGLLLGVFVFLHPASTIEIQRKFYLKINWKIEPVSMPKEIRNTKVMGLLLILVSFSLLVYLLL
ncbi:MAG: hypothetical protein C4540_02680 [Candidatus Omnitrophota bacterium]|jgi:hypothetical protein|nr:MAG: hypothetical protein C4540_02680 [Candidatus Omnitrophota bacterium]